MNAFEDDRAQLTGLHFAQDAMRVHERATLHLAEAMQRRCEAVLRLHMRIEVSGTAWHKCMEDGLPWPCATYRAITGEMAATAGRP